MQTIDIKLKKMECHSNEQMKHESVFVFMFLLCHTRIFFIFSTSCMSNERGFGGASSNGMQLIELSLASFGLKLG